MLIWLLKFPASTVLIADFKICFFNILFFLTDGLCDQRHLTIYPKVIKFKWDCACESCTKNRNLKIKWKIWVRSKL